MTTWYDNLLARFNLIRREQHEHIVKSTSDRLSNAYQAQSLVNAQSVHKFHSETLMLQDQKVDAIKMLEDVLQMKFVPKQAKSDLRYVIAYLKRDASTAA